MATGGGFWVAVRDLPAVPKISIFDLTCQKACGTQSGAQLQTRLRDEDACQRPIVIGY